MKTLEEWTEDIEAIVARFRETDQYYIEKAAKRIAEIGTLLPSDLDRLAVMMDMYTDIDDIVSRLAEAVALGERDMRTLFYDILTDVEHNPTVDRAIENGSLPLTERERFLQYTDAVARQTAREMANLSNTTVLSDTYRKAVDQGVLAVSTGMSDYKSVMRKIIKEIGHNGLQVQYASGYHRRLDSAVRQNILDATRQVAQNAADAVAEAYGIDAIELSAHARPAPDHAPVQGHVFLREEFDKMQSGSGCTDIDGNTFDGFPRRIGEWNCMHFAAPFDTRYSVRRYTPEELGKMLEDNEKGCDIGGKHYTLYQASQLMRRLETMSRREKDAANACRAAGDMDGRRQCQERINAISRKYADVAQASGLPMQKERMSVEGFRRVRL